MTVASHNMSRVFAVLRPDMSVSQEAVRPALYPALDANYNHFHKHALVACHDFAKDWGSWEAHPAGDEIVVLVSGAATMVLWQDDAEVAVTLDAPGAYVVVPRGVWHTARISQPTKMLFVTPGEGTQHGDGPTNEVD